MTATVFENSLIGVSVEGLDPLIKGLDKMTPLHKEEAGNAIAKYLLNVLQAYPPEKRVTRKQAYGVTFFSDAQRRYFFWALENKVIVVPYRRTQTFRKLWKILGSGIDAIVVNDSPVGEILMGDNYQSRMSAKIGWKKVSQVVKEREQKLDKIIEEAGKRAMRKSGFKD